MSAAEQEYFSPFTDYEVIALDIAEEMLKRAKEKSAHNVVEYVCGSAELLPFQDNSFSRVLCFCLSAFDDPAASLKEASGLLNQAGHW